MKTHTEGWGLEAIDANYEELATSSVTIVRKTSMPEVRNWADCRQVWVKEAPDSLVSGALTPRSVPASG
jgi:hypothetical protein